MVERHRTVVVVLVVVAYCAQLAASDVWRGSVHPTSCPLLHPLTRPRAYSHPTSLRPFLKHSRFAETRHQTRSVTFSQ